MATMGIEVKDLQKGRPGGNLPQWVKDATATRGYGDSTAPLSLYITEADVEAAFAALAHGDGAACVMAQAGTRLGAKHVYFYRTTAWVDFGEGPILRYETSQDIWRHVIKPFDSGDRDLVRPGVYHLLPPKKERLGSIRRRGKRPRVRDKSEKKRKSTNPNPYMGRVVMATQPGKKAS